MLLVAALGLFGYSSTRWFKIIRSGKSDDRFNDFRKRIKNIVTIAFAQTKMIKGDPKAGIMHALIFWGFCVIALRTILLFGMGFSPSFGSFFTQSIPGHLYTLLLNIFELLVLMAVSYAAYRRIVIKPKRLTLSAEGLGILGMIAALMITDFLFEGARIALGAHRVSV